MYGTAPFVADIDAKKREAALAAGAAEAFDPADPSARKALFKASGGIYAACDFVGSDASLNFATGVLAKGGKVVVTGLIGGAYSTAVAMFPLKAMAIEGTMAGTLKEARELIDLVRTKNVSPPPIAERPFNQASKTLDDLRAGLIIGRVVLTV
jgi:D-arabinose 1-dehydrogenase-like Zn-dependent alcohol dehydrogenase